MKGLIISAGSSNSGKTSISLGLLDVFRRKGYNLGSFKLGADYIDTAYHSKITGGKSANLDLHLQGKDGVFQAMARNPADIFLIEGAMGYFDGIGSSYENSAFDMAKTLALPSILIYRPKGEMFSAIPKIKGMVDFSKGAIKGVIFSMVSESAYTMLKKEVEDYIGIRVLGYMPKNQDLTIASRHLGLLQADELENLDGIVSLAGDLCETYIDIQGLEDLAVGFMGPVVESFPRYGIKIGVARDQAFSFHFKENIQAFKEMGELRFFSPLEDKQIPECDLLVIGGGYPELYLDDLEKNKSMRKSIREFAESGAYLLAYGGGYPYLSQSFDGREMCKVFPGHGLMTEKLQNFGYSYISFGKNYENLPVREFHRSKFDKEACDFEVEKLSNRKKWRAGSKYKNSYGFYGHFSVLGWRGFFEDLGRRISKNVC